MGTDKVTLGSEVYTYKNGQDYEKHLWVIEEAEAYPVDHTQLFDCYPDRQLPDDDPRANAYEGYKLVFAQEFGDENPSHDVWNFEQSFCCNQEDKWYNGDKNIYVQESDLGIQWCSVESEKIRNPRYESANNNWPSRIGEYNTWTSGSIMTKGSKNGDYTLLYVSTRYVQRCRSISGHGLRYGARALSTNGLIATRLTLWNITAITFTAMYAEAMEDAGAVTGIALQFTTMCLAKAGAMSITSGEWCEIMIM